MSLNKLLIRWQHYNYISTHLTIGSRCREKAVTEKQLYPKSPATRATKQSQREKPEH